MGPKSAHGIPIGSKDGVWRLTGDDRHSEWIGPLTKPSPSVSTITALYTPPQNSNASGRLDSGIMATKGDGTDSLESDGEDKMG